MEQLNKVQIRGIVGNSTIRNIGETQMIRFSVATDHMYKTNGGDIVVETTWHQVTAFKNDKMPDFSAIVRGVGVEVNGRLRSQRYTDSNGEERTTIEVLANSISLA